MKLWKYNPITGYWFYVRDVTEENGLTWLGIFQRDEPTAKYKLAKRKPNV
jgi:hypothetical protein